MDEWLILELKHRMYKINLEYLIVPEMKEFLKTKWRGYAKNTEKPAERIPSDQNRNNLNDKINSLVFYGTPLQYSCLENHMGGGAP